MADLAFDHDGRERYFAVFLSPRIGGNRHSVWHVQRRVFRFGTCSFARVHKAAGLMHVPWVPMIAAQIGLYSGFNSASNYSLWLTAATLITAISLVIDAIDVAVFFKTKKD